MSKGKQVMAKEDQLPSYIKKGTGRGSENVGTQDIQIPRIDIIQDLSPQHKENKPEYIPGAKVGMLFNTLTKDLYPDGINVVPVYYDKQWIVWKDQKKGGGFKGAFPKDQQKEAEALARELGEDYEVVETPTQICILCDDEGMPLHEVSIPMAKSKMKVNKQWNSLIRLQGGDRFSRMYRLVSVEDSNSEGQEYLNYQVSRNGFPTQEAYEMAELLYEQIVSGAVRATTNYSDAVEGAKSDVDDTSY